MNIKFDKNTIYCSYKRQFLNKAICEKYCNILCKSNKAEFKDWKMSEEEYYKNYKPLEDIEELDTFGL